jgi:hypothetical protein
MDTRPPWKKGYRQYLWIGLFVVAFGVYIAKEAFDSFHTGVPVHMSNSSSMSAVEASGFSVLVILLGILFIAVGLGWNKLKGQHPSYGIKRLYFCRLPCLILLVLAAYPRYNVATLKSS